MYERIVRTAALISAYVGAAALALMMLHICLAIVVRTFFGTALPQTVETVSYIYMLAVVFLPLAVTELAGEQVAVGLVADHLKGISRRAVQLFAMVAALIYYALMAWQTGITAIAKMKIGEYAMGAFALPLWPGRILLPVGSGLLALVLVLRIIQLVRGGDLQDLETGHGINTGE